jgi:hypothetical protein
MIGIVILVVVKLVAAVLIAFAALAAFIISLEFG